MKYRQLNAEERSVLAALRTLGLSRAEIWSSGNSPSGPVNPRQ